jgi:hypothetical protein
MLERRVDFRENSRSSSCHAMLKVEKQLQQVIHQIEYYICLEHVQVRRARPVKRPPKEEGTKEKKVSTIYTSNEQMRENIALKSSSSWLTSCPTQSPMAWTVLTLPSAPHQSHVSEKTRKLIKPRNQSHKKKKNKSRKLTFPFVGFNFASSVTLVSSSFSIIPNSVLHLLCNSCGDRLLKNQSNRNTGNSVISFLIRSYTSSACIP